MLNAVPSTGTDTVSSVVSAVLIWCLVVLPYRTTNSAPSEATPSTAASVTGSSGGASSSTMS